MVSPVKLQDGYMVRFRTLLAEQVHKKFSYGENDCMLFIADVLIALTGIDLAQELRGTYNNDGSAYNRLYELTGEKGYNDAVSAILEQNGLIRGISEEIPSVCIIGIGEHEVGGVYYGGKVWAFQPNGFLHFSKDKIIKSWVV